MERFHIKSIEKSNEFLWIPTTLILTSRERPKSAPYLRLKKTKTTFSTTGDNKSTQKTKNSEKIFFLEFFWSLREGRIVPKNVKGETRWDFFKIHDPFCCKISKIDGRNNKKNSEKNQSHSAEKRRKVS